MPLARRGLGRAAGGDFRRGHVVDGDVRGVLLPPLLRVDAVEPAVVARDEVAPLQDLQRLLARGGLLLRAARTRAAGSAPAASAVPAPSRTRAARASAVSSPSFLFGGGAGSQTCPRDLFGAREVYNRGRRPSETGAGGFLAALEPGERVSRHRARDGVGRPVRRAARRSSLRLLQDDVPDVGARVAVLRPDPPRSARGASATFAVSQDDRAETARVQPTPGRAARNALRSAALEGVGGARPHERPDVLPGRSRTARIRETVVGFQSRRLEELARRAAKLAGRPAARLFRIGDTIPLIVPG